MGYLNKKAQALNVGTHGWNLIPYAKKEEEEQGTNKKKWKKERQIGIHGWMRKTREQERTDDVHTRCASHASAKKKKKTKKNAL